MLLRPLSRSSMLSIRAVIGFRIAANRASSTAPRKPSVAPKLRIAVASFAPEGVEVRDTLRVGAKSVCTAAGTTPAAEHMALEENNEVKLLPAVADDHGGVIVEMKDPIDPREFISSLRLSIFHWRQQGKKGVWIKLPIELANLVQPAVEEGFWYHHAEPSYLMLVYWIPSTEHTLPVNASHRVGVGAFVLNDKKEVLAVQEKSGKLRGTGIWKFPTGVVDQGEDLCSGAIREVKEETGIDTEFVEVLAFRYIALLVQKFLFLFQRQKCVVDSFPTIRGRPTSPSLTSLTCFSCAFCDLRHLKLKSKNLKSRIASGSLWRNSLHNLSPKNTSC